MSTRTRAVWLAVVILAWAGAGASNALTISGPGLDAGGACPESGGACGSIDYAFDVTPAPATGDIDFTFGGGINWTVDIDANVASLTMEDTAGAVDGVDRIVFSNLEFDVVGWSAVEFSGQISGLATTGTVSGTYEQFLGNVSVAGPTNFGPVAVGAGSLTCNATLTGVCGFTFGFDAPELLLDVGTTNGGSPHEFVWTFNVIVPEPSPALLVALGLLTICAAQRRRRPASQRYLP